MMEYYATDDRRLVLRYEAGLMERYDYYLDRWVEDREMFSIYIGEPLVDVVTKTEAHQCIETVRQER